MEGSVVMTGLSPHPPIIVPDVGQGEEQKASSTVAAMDALGKQFAESDIDTLVVVTPHGPAFSDAVSISGLKTFEGNFLSFGSKVGVSLKNDLELAKAIAKVGADNPIQTVLLDKVNLGRYGIGSELDHGTLVPLFYFKKHGFNKPVVIVNIGFLPYFDLYLFGSFIERCAFRLGRRIGVLASGDLSHRLSKDSPAGFNPKGQLFDKSLMEKLAAFSASDILLMSPALIEDAGECGLRPISIMLGALDKAAVEAKVLSYEGPFGVGYGVVSFKPMGWDEANSRIGMITGSRKARMKQIRKNESYPVALARKTVERLLSGGDAKGLTDETPGEFNKRAGVFVSIHKEGNLRGCIGTIEPATESIADEIVNNAISAARHDPRFDPIEPHELDFLDYFVDILSAPEKIGALSELDPKLYGVICAKGSKKGLLLPDLPGVNSVSEQLSIAKRKAGIDPNDKKVEIYRFTVTRYS